ncbi:MAG: hypothetical protein IJS69_01720 [Selenomonadaceae bacterium]|nr:hypothetical protein [Selenomonadaceae bacterium]
MNKYFIFGLAYMIIFSLCVILGDNVVKSWWSFFFGAIFALSLHDVGSEFKRRSERRQSRRVR